MIDTAPLLAKLRAETFLEDQHEGGKYVTGWNARSRSLIRWLTEAPVLAGLKELRNTAVDYASAHEMGGES